MKKLWIASILATLMLIVPMTSVVGASEVVDEDCVECQPVNRVDLLKVKLLLIRIKAVTNLILSRFGHIPEVAEKCEEVIDNINSIGLNDIICNILMRIGIYLEELGKKFPIGTLLYPILAMMMIPVIILWNMFCD